MVPEISLAHWLSRHHPEVSRGAGRTPGCETGGGKGVTQTMQRHARPRFPIKKKKISDEGGATYHSTANTAAPFTGGPGDAR